MDTVHQPDVTTWHFARGTASVATMVGFAVEHGVPVDRMLAGTGLSAAGLADPDAQITAETELTVVRTLLREVGAVPALGAEVGRRYRISTFGIFGYACITSPNLGEAIALALRYYRLGFAFCIPVVEVGDSGVVARIHNDTVPADVREFLTDRDVVAMYQVTSDLLGGPLDLTRVEFDHPAGDRADRMAEIFGVRPQFDARYTSFALDRAQLAQPLPQSNPATWAACIAQCQDLIRKRSTRTGIAAEVRDRLLPTSGAAGFAVPPTFDRLAHDLNVSPRTLRRHLDAAGTSYRALLDEVRHTLAEEMLSGTSLSVDDVAVRLGYAEATPFIHAFKRWTGTTPAAYRRGARP
ncbi:AraC family transcriptional regulator [Nocardia stercoris]|uniref:AraC family transcriptional regulator n=1 Tax=Nocardia stercoris TaxID=2483361 RepID=UPI001F31A314|nr:AraC family transcriptional regulator [Nocardia stercoris]